MSISSKSAVHAASAAAQSGTADSVNIFVLKKALDMQAASAATMLQALPQPALAAEGTLGTRINTFA